MKLSIPRQTLDKPLTKKLRDTIHPAAIYCIGKSAAGYEYMIDIFNCVLSFVGAIYKSSPNANIDIEKFDDEGYILVIATDNGTEVHEIDHGVFEYEKYPDSTLIIDMSGFVTLPSWYTSHIKQYEIKNQAKGQ